MMPSQTAPPTVYISPQPAAFFAADGYYNTAPGSTLSLIIQPNYYSAIVRSLMQASCVTHTLCFDCIVTAEPVCLFFNSCCRAAAR